MTHRQGFVPATTQKGTSTMKKTIVGGLAHAKAVVADHLRASAREWLSEVR